MFTSQSVQRQIQQIQACWTLSLLLHSWTMNKDGVKSDLLPDEAKQHCLKHRLKEE